MKKGAIKIKNEHLLINRCTIDSRQQQAAGNNFTIPNRPQPTLAQSCIITLERPALEKQVGFNCGVLC
jgi:hypothetical protein